MLPAVQPGCLSDPLHGSAQRVAFAPYPFFSAQAHAAAAFFDSPFRHALVIVAHGAGQACWASRGWGCCRATLQLPAPG